MISKETKERAKTIKEKIGRDKVKDIANYLAARANKRHLPAQTVQSLMNKYILSLKGASACWCAWQTYII